MRLKSVLVLSLILAATSPSTGRMFDNWSYSKLFKAADLVVIARAGPTVDTGAKPTDPRYADMLVGEETQFTIESVLQGKAPVGGLTVRHFRFADSNKIGFDGPQLAFFRTKPRVFKGPDIGYVSLGIPDYLLFLRPTGDGAFEPVSGQIDAAQSVKEMYGSSGGE